MSKTSDSGPDSTTQHCVALILALARNIPQDDAAMKSGGWQAKDAMGLSGKTFGTVGLGRLGVSVSKIMHLAFGMRVIAWSSNLTQDAADEKAKAAGLPVTDKTGAKTFKVVSRDELFSTADVVSIQLVLSERSRGLIGKEDLEKMKRSALFVNTSRGPIVNEDELLESGKKGQIRGIGLDVYGLEPLPNGSEWRTTKWGESGRSEVVMTPHTGYVVGDTIRAWYEQQVENILRWEKGEALATLFKDNGY
ncbi:D-isomer specific 2-hydroxyacid dehydrogenase [Nemania sp. FL0031]|nr:D-isomer specific 2-hydroxyacid dehydrogenase [Nemania sp. FL0031]